MSSNTGVSSIINQLKIHNMTKDELITKQQLEIEEYKQKLIENTELKKT